MRAHVLNGDGRIERTILVASLDFMPGLVDASIGGQIGDRIVDGIVVRGVVAPANVPASVTRRQARQALLLAGLLDQVQVAIDAIPDPVQRGMLQIEWDDGQTFDRDRPTVLTIGAALGLDDAGLDQLFIAAAAL